MTITAAFGAIPETRAAQIFKWFPQDSKDLNATRQVICERLRPGDRLWTAQPPSLIIPRVAPGDWFAQWICDSGEGPPAHCDIEAVFLSSLRWVVYWTSGAHCYGGTLCADMIHNVRKNGK